MIALVDCNNFYCSCERLFEPKLVDRPLMVLSSNDGCVVARSNEVKALGILTGTPLFQVRELVRRHNIVVRSSNFSLYGDMSWRVMRTLEQLCADVEIYSIDEAFLHVDAPEEALLELGRKARRTVLQHTGIPVSVGIGPTKTLAKAASKLAKSDPEGVFSVIDSAVRDAALERLPVEHVWGVGPAYAKTLAREGITTARALRDADLAFVRKKITVGGVRTVMELRGQPSFHRGDEPAPRHQILRAGTFGQPVESLAEMEQAVAMRATRTAQKLREQRLAAAQVQVFILTNRHKSDQPQYRNSITIKLPIPTDATDAVIAAALLGLRSIYRPGYAYRKAGVVLLDLTSAKGAPQTLFAELKSPQSSRLDPTLDAVNRRFGAHTLRYAVVGFRQKWTMRREFCSPRYTTCWEELPTVTAGRASPAPGMLRPDSIPGTLPAGKGSNHELSASLVRCGHHPRDRRRIPDVPIILP